MRGHAPQLRHGPEGREPVGTGRSSSRPESVAGDRVIQQIAAQRGFIRNGPAGGSDGRADCRCTGVGQVAQLGPLATPEGSTCPPPSMCHTARRRILRGEGLASNLTINNPIRVRPHPPTVPGSGIGSRDAPLCMRDERPSLRTVCQRLSEIQLSMAFSGLHASSRQATASWLAISVSLVEVQCGLAAEFPQIVHAVKMACQSID